MKKRGKCFKCHANITIQQIAGREEIDGEVVKIHYYCSKFWESQNESKNELKSCIYCEKVVKVKDGIDIPLYIYQDFFCSWDCLNDYNDVKVGKLLVEMKEIAVH